MPANQEIPARHASRTNYYPLRRPTSPIIRRKTRNNRVEGEKEEENGKERKPQLERSTKGKGDGTGTARKVRSLILKILWDLMSTVWLKLSEHEQTTMSKAGNNEKNTNTEPSVETISAEAEAVGRPNTASAATPTSPQSTPQARETGSSRTRAPLPEVYSQEYMYPPPYPYSPPPGAILYSRYFAQETPMTEPSYSPSSTYSTPKEEEEGDLRN